MSKKKKFKFKGKQERFDSRLHVYTDGSSFGNPGPGGWGVVIQHMESQIILSKGYRWTTNNRQEMMSVIHTLEELGPARKFNIYTDSQYTIDGCTGWVHGWSRNDWLTRGGEPVKNKDLWMKLHHLMKENEVRFVKVLGHSGDVLNEVADAAAKRGSANPTEIDEEYEKENPCPTA